MSVLSVDLAYRRWSDLGVVILDQEPQAQSLHRRGVKRPTIACEIVPFAATGPDGKICANRVNAVRVDAEILAGRLNDLCAARGIRVMMLDGPQAWKSGDSGLRHARVSERELNTAAKTGLPGVVTPRTYRTFAEFCIDVYDALCRRGWKRLSSRGRGAMPHERVLVESYPYAAWKSLGLKPLCSKRRARASDLAECHGALRSLIPFTTNRPPNHDQLQAIVGGLAGLALEGREMRALRIVGDPPRREDGHWREGFIVLPARPVESALRWMN
jgi:hypothetical protein